MSHKNIPSTGTPAPAPENVQEAQPGKYPDPLVQCGILADAAAHRDCHHLLAQAGDHPDLVAGSFPQLVWQ